MRWMGTSKKLLKLSRLALLVSALVLGSVWFHQPAQVAGASNGQIAFTRSSTGIQIYTMNADGSNVQHITTPNDSFGATWSPDSTKLVYSTLVSGVYQIAVMNADGSSQTQLTTGANDSYFPGWSPDGTKLLFSCSDGSYIQLCVMNADGTGQIQITNTTSGVPISADWSITNRIAYGCYDGTHQQICTMNPDGTGNTQITNATSDYEGPKWSADGSRIVFQDQGFLYVYRIGIMNADGSNLQHITTAATDVQYPDWSPDNTKIIYSNFNSGTDTARRIYTINIDGSGEAAVSPNDGVDADIPSWQQTVTTDQDSDGVASSIEKAGPNNGDANNDGIGDYVQSNVASFVNPITGQYAVVQSNCSSATGTTAAAATQADSGFAYPAGLLSFTLHCSTAGATATVTTYVYGLTFSSSFALRKYNPTTKQYQTVPGATVAGVTIGGKTVTKATYQIVDGGPLDQDGAANGVVVDPVGVAQPNAGVPNTGLGGTAL
jgi:hypothetical protein